MSHTCHSIEYKSFIGYTALTLGDVLQSQCTMFPISKLTWLSHNLQFLGVWLTFRYRNLKNPRRHAGDFLWLPYSHSSLSYLQLKNSFIIRYLVGLCCERACKASLASFWGQCFYYVLILQFRCRSIVAPLNATFQHFKNSTFILQIIGTVLAYRYRNLMDPSLRQPSASHLFEEQLS